MGLARAAFRLTIVMLAMVPIGLLLWLSWEWSQLSDDERMDTGVEVMEAMERQRPQNQPPPPRGQPYVPRDQR